MVNLKHLIRKNKFRYIKFLINYFILRKIQLIKFKRILNLKKTLIKNNSFHPKIIQILKHKLYSMNHKFIIIEILMF